MKGVINAYGICALLVLNRTLLNSINALLVLSRRYQGKWSYSLPSSGASTLSTGLDTQVLWLNFPREIHIFQTLLLGFSVNYGTAWNLWKHLAIRSSKRLEMLLTPFGIIHYLKPRPSPHQALLWDILSKEYKPDKTDTDLRCTEMEEKKKILPLMTYIGPLLILKVFGRKV